MSDLHIGLLAIGAAIVTAVLLYNWMQERRFKKQADAAFQAPVADVLMQPDAVPAERYLRIEPALRESEVDADAAEEAPIVIEPRLAVEAAVPFPAAAAAPFTPADALGASPYDELIEYRVRVGEVADAGVLADAHARSRTLGKTVRWLGLPADDDAWEEIQPWRGGYYRQVMVTLQLADRNGAVLEDQLATFCGLLQDAALAHGLRVACDDVDAALERAQAIDRFCVDVDVLIGLTVVARGDGALDLGRIVHEVDASGEVLAADGAFQLLDSRGEPLYALCKHDAEPFGAAALDGQTTPGITLQFDVPRVPDGLKVFDGMVAFGRRLANESGGILVDDNLRPLTDGGIEKIRAQLADLYARMEARGVPSGSRRSLRLFS
jgi:hypothetical protein